MSKIALLFPGLGGQAMGMGGCLRDNFLEARRVFEEVDAALGRPLSRLMLEGPSSELMLTRNAQPAIVATSMAVTAILRNHSAVFQFASFVAGHSLGEYSALHAAGSIDGSATIKL